NFASLTPYGNQIINHANFGLQTYPPAKSQYLVHDAYQMKIKTFLSGYYSGAQTMRNVLYLQNIIPSPSNQVDTIQIEFHQSNSPYSSIYTAKTVLQTNGNATVQIPLSLIGSSYYIAIKHRNTIETWSANPIMIGSITHYDYTNAMNKAYGSNQIEVSSGVWALYTGDINQDDNIDLLDNSQLELGIQNFLFGYQIEDLNGDGNVDLLDGSIIEDNINGFIFSIHP
ncbi:MAG TPA: hypothetical protein PLU17_12295, partial [Chitinophagaceae bacterium]|nr:hypothetical protein [Chitinophagaceae bacterium]